jgi:hypothetical protein
MRAAAIAASHVRCRIGIVPPVRAVEFSPLVVLFWAYAALQER